METLLLKNQELSKAVSGILQRSERHRDDETLRDTFVDVGVLSQLNNANNQIIYGRRGTGKTHVFRVLPPILHSCGNAAVCYIDARTLGSTNQFSDATLPIGVRCISLFRDVLGELHNTLLDFVVGLPGTRADKAMESLVALANVATQSLTTTKPTQITENLAQKVTKESGGSVDLSANAVTARLSATTSTEAASAKTVMKEVQTEDKILFPELKTYLDDIFKSCESELYILFDEWSSIPQELQPYLAEFFKRSFIPNPRIILKIASLEYRSRFLEQRPQGGYVGFELGGDIASTLDLDDYYVYDRNPEFVTRAFGNMLFRHLSSDLPEDYLSSSLCIGNGDDFASKLFTSRTVFDELVRASEGVARDLINIFTSAYFDAQRRDINSIDKRAVIEAARQWYEKDKSSTLDEELSKVLRTIVDEVIGRRKARSFLVETRFEKHRVIQRLFDYRVIHLMRRGYADKENPGVRYNIYSLDYGTYVDLLNTSKQPVLGFEEASDGPNAEFVVPFDDKRSIRRNIVTEEMLNTAKS